MLRIWRKVISARGGDLEIQLVVLDQKDSLAAVRSPMITGMPYRNAGWWLVLATTGGGEKGGTECSEKGCKCSGGRISGGR